MAKENIYILVFKSYNQSMLLYNKLYKQGCDVELICTPCSISKSCTQCIRFKESYMDLIKKEASNLKIDVEGIYKLVKKLNLNTYERVE